MTPFRWCLMILWSTTLLGQSKEACALDNVRNGDRVKIRGAVFPTGHDVFIRPADCSESADNRVILVWGDDPSLGPNKAEVRRDAAFAEFNDRIKATFPLPAGGAGVGQSRYRVVAEFEGRLVVAASAGLKRDLTGKKVVGTEGSGHPMPFTRFRLVATSVSHLEAVEQQPVVQHDAGHSAPIKRP